MNLQPILEFALEAAWQAGRITLGYFQTGVAVERKADNSPVTAADRAAETKLREMISHAWPTYGIIGEEFGQTDGSDSLTWIIDPIDGTKSFMQGVPLYGVLVALTENGRTLAGVAHFPALNETVYAARGLGCYWDGRRAHVSAVDTLKDAIFTSSELRIRDPQKAINVRRLVEAAYIGRTWGDAYGYALVATGRAEIMLDERMKIWDCAPLQVILEEAGGTFTDWKGTPAIDAGESLATNGKLLPAVLELLNT